MDNSNLRPEDLGLELDDEDVLDVLDLPQLHQKPTATSLLKTLALLQLEPRSWDSTPPLTARTTPLSTPGNTTPITRKQKVRSEGVPQYLTRIISSPLAWLADDEEKETVWDAASVRLSERSGRTGMGAITRSFRIPLSPPTHSSSKHSSSTMQPVITSSQDKEQEKGNERQEDAEIEIAIHEPALTEDNLGLKTWASSFVLARKWKELKHRLPPLSPFPHPAILELGAGTGLVGLAAAAVLGTGVLLTDLPDIVPNLSANIASNRDSIESLGGNVSAAVLDWTVPEKIIYPPQSKDEVLEYQEGRRRSLVAEPVSSKYPLIVAADPIYSPRHAEWLVQTLGYHLYRGDEDEKKREGEDMDTNGRRNARAVVIIPIREAYAAERKDFRDRMEGLGLTVDFEETDVGFDDWSEGKGEELMEVECWITCWRWKD